MFYTLLFSLSNTCKNSSLSIHRNLSYIVPTRLSFSGCKTKTDYILSRRPLNLSCLYISEELRKGHCWVPKKQSGTTPIRQPAPRLVSFTSQPRVLKLCHTQQHLVLEIQEDMVSFVLCEQQFLNTCHVGFCFVLKFSPGAKGFEITSYLRRTTQSPGHPEESI